MPEGSELQAGSGGTQVVVQGTRLVTAWQISPADAPVRVGPDRRPCSSRPGVVVVHRADRLAESATWTARSGTRVLTLRPTWVARTWAGAADGLVAELADVAPELADRGMRDQLRCHLAFAPQKAVWHLEPARPEVGYAATVAARCNPGDLLDPDGR